MSSLYTGLYNTRLRISSASREAFVEMYYQTSTYSKNGDKFRSPIILFFIHFKVTFLFVEQFKYLSFGYKSSIARIFSFPYLPLHLTMQEG